MSMWAVPVLRVSGRANECHRGEPEPDARNARATEMINTATRCLRICPATFVAGVERNSNRRIVGPSTNMPTMLATLTYPRYAVTSETYVVATRKLRAVKRMLKSSAYDGDRSVRLITMLRS
jgi:hypothetical protein